MHKLTFYIFICIMLISFSMNAQVTTKTLDNVQISTTKAVFLGKSIPIRDAVPKTVTPKIKKQNSKINKKVPDNFKGRKNRSSAVDASKEHQPDPVLQSEINKSITNQLEILVNRQGFGQGSPTDPTGDVSDQYYVQAVNATQVAVFQLNGILEMTFPMNTLWTQFGSQSAGDPIILFDENTDRWILTEFTGPANLLVAVSVTNDPLGAYNAFSFSTPNFPDYPKYAITPDALVVTTNEEGRGTLHQYFISMEELIAGDGNATIQRIAVPGSNGTEQGFFVSTPVDFNGTNMPFDNNPIVLRLNDSSWSDGPEQDGIELYSFEVDFDEPNNTQVIQTSIPTAPFDAFPCSATGFGFACIPQLNGGGLDGIPEVIMNVPHQRNFGTHESLVYTFVTDVENGNNRAGIRWVELRRDSESGWSVFQEGTFAPDDGLDRFMSSIAIDSRGHIALGYNASSPETFAGIRITGRNDGDPLGEMTYDEVVLQEGLSTINSGGRFGDYSQMSVAPGGLSEFWFTTEYAGANNTVSNIAAVRLRRDSFDLAMRSFITPAATSSNLTDSESVIVEVINAGINPISNFTLELQLDGVVVSTSQISQELQASEILMHTYPDNIDLSLIQDYTLTSTVSSTQDQNPLNNTLDLNLSVLPGLEAQIDGEIIPLQCDGTLQGSLLLQNLGGDVISSASIGATVNGVTQPNISFKGSISNEQATEIDFNFPIDAPGAYVVELEILSLNGASGDFDATNNIVALETEALGADSFITVNLITDNFPAETSYTIVSATTGMIVAELNNLDANDVATLFSNRVCLDIEDCYTITINDTYGDGICCGYGEGSLNITDNEGNSLISSNGEFGFQQVLTFCAEAMECALEVDIDVTDSEPGNVGTGVILISASNGVMPFQYSINGGATFVPSNSFLSLLPGDYDVVVTDATGNCVVEETVTVGFLTSTYQIEGATVNVDILPNPTDGVFKINVNNLPTLEDYLQVNIYDIQGKLIQQRNIGKFDNDFIGSFSLYGYPAGTYLVRIATPELNILEKVVRQ